MVWFWLFGMLLTVFYTNHRLLMLLYLRRYCMQAAQKRDFLAILDNGTPCTAWKIVVQQVFSVTNEALQVAMQVVAEVVFISFILCLFSFKSISSSQTIAIMILILVSNYI